ncbi:MAG: tetratricopeptide repeat protein [Sulfuricellaceae bacterium]
MATISTRRLALLLAGIACFITLDCLAAASLNGVVRKNQMGGEPLAHVSVSAPDAGGPTATDDSGRFNLAFPRLAPGDRVDLDVKLKGWVVVNDLQLSGYNLPKDARVSPLTILLAREAERERYALQYYRLKGNEAVLAEYQRKLAEQTQKNQTTAQERDALALERDKALALVDELAKQLSTAKPGAGDERYRQAMQLFLSNHLDEALALLSEQKLQADAEQALLLEKNARKMKEEAAKNYRLRGQLLTLRFQFDDAAKAYLATTVLLPDDFQTWFDFAIFHQELNHFSEARQGYEKALSIARANPDTYRPKLADTLNNLAVLHRNQNRYDEARQAFEEALGIYHGLAHTNSYRPKVAIVLNNLAILHRNQNHYDEARKVYQEALDIYHDLARTNSDTYRPGVARTLNNLAVLHRNQNRYDEARQAFEEALDIYRDLARTNPNTYRPDVAMTLNNLAILHYDQNRYDEAIKDFQEALTIRRDLARTNPDAYWPDVATSLSNLAVLQNDQNRFEEARNAYQEALMIRRDFARTNPDTYRPYVALTLNNMAILHKNQNRYDEARKAYQEALDIYREFSARNPETYAPYVRKVQANFDKLPK